MSRHPSNPDQLMAKALGVCWHSPTADRWPCSDLTPPPSAAVPDPADVEKAARAIWETDPLFRLTPWEDAHPASRELYRRLAVAALAAVRPSPDSEAVARVLALARDLHTDARSMWAAAETHDSETDELIGDTYFEVSKRIRAALGTGDREGTDRG